MLTTTVGSGATLKLFNLPSEKTSATSAAITYELEAPAAGATTVVACRLNTYTPIVCPNPFRLGQRSELPAGVHTVQYYVDTGNGVNPAKPDASYSWTIEVAASSTAGTVHLRHRPVAPRRLAASRLRRRRCRRRCLVRARSGMGERRSLPTACR
jgi:hypothetical protein